MSLMTYFSFLLTFFFFTNIYSTNEAEYHYGEESLEYVDDEIATAQPEEQRFEGDILGLQTYENGSPNVQYSAMSSQESRWPHAIVPFTISRLFTCIQRCVIYEAMKEIEMKTCVSFTELDSNKSEAHVQILKNDICASYVGYSPPKQLLYLSNECLENVGTPLHELMHTLGFFHEHTRRDRDDHISVNEANIRDDAIINFRRHDYSNVTNLGFQYDFASVLHYDSYAYSKNGQPTITVKGKPSLNIGQRQQLSEMDARKLNKYYNCSEDRIGCIDTNPRCKKAWNWKNRCKYDNELRKGCLKSCKLCASSKALPCSDALERCKNYVSRSRKTSGEECDENLKKVIYKLC